MERVKVAAWVMIAVALATIATRDLVSIDAYAGAAPASVKCKSMPIDPPKSAAEAPARSEQVASTVSDWLQERFAEGASSVVFQTYVPTTGSIIACVRL